MQLFTALLSALALVASTTTANPEWVANYSPLQVLEPGWGETWQIGSSKRVLWNWIGMPLGDQYLTGSIILGNAATSSDNKTVNIPPLATGVPLFPGEVNVTVPNVPSSHSYFIILRIDGSSTGEEHWGSNFSITA